MSKITFETIEAALAHIATQDATILANATEIKTLKDDAVKTGRDLAGALAEVTTLSKKLDLVEKHTGENVTVVTIGKKSYKLLGNRFFVKGEEVTAEELMKDDAELKRLVKIKSGSLVELTDSED